VLRAAALLAMPLLLAACATVPPPAPGTVNSPMPGRAPEPVGAGSAAGQQPAGGSSSPMPGARVGTTASGGSITVTSPAVVDTTPSADALAVLHTIQEPLGGAGQEGDGAALDSLGRAAGVPDSADVPVPAETRPLGDRPGAKVTPADSAAAAGPPPTGSGAPASVAPAGSAGATAGAPPDSCWRIQVAAPPEPDRARSLRDAAQSQLLVAMVIEVEKGLQKVRSRDCMGADAAERLKQRAIAAGFAGAFRFRPAP
jgi:hypothetical protein